MILASDDDDFERLIAKSLSAQDFDYLSKEDTILSYLQDNSLAVKNTDKIMDADDGKLTTWKNTLCWII